MNKGNNAWQITMETLIRLPSIPALMNLYWGAVKKWVVKSAFMVLSGGGGGGEFNATVDESFLIHKGIVWYKPAATVVYFQDVFAAITPILIRWGHAREDELLCMDVVCTSVDDILI
ncbi:hypothetical protein MLD38_006025 [Melastoma candidum]|uniref:Uncharacterized protein n=1 Tax=Melastoma candidum TaxID=119954 RepID=A0ACB9RKZ8_9MYRT|nr:hypothetical protein MLD38_006025 [Melastoma candidum]